MKTKSLFIIVILIFFWGCEEKSTVPKYESNKITKLISFAKELNTKFELTAETIPFFELALELNPKNYLANGNLGTIYLKSQNFSKALHYLTKAVVIRPDDIELNLNIGHAYFAVDQYEKSLEFLEKGAQLIQSRIQKFLLMPQTELKNLSEKLALAYAVGGVAADQIGDGKKSISNTQKAYKKFLSLKDFKNANFAKKKLNEFKIKYK